MVELVRTDEVLAVMSMREVSMSSRFGQSSTAAPTLLRLSIIEVTSDHLFDSGS